MVDLLVAAVVVASLAGVTIPLVSQVTDAVEVRAAAGYFAGRLRQMRFHAVTSGRAAALAFDEEEEGWVVRRCYDGNDNGIRRAELASRIDVCADEAETLRTRFPSATFALAPGIPDVDGAVGSTAGIRFGASRLASCSPAGHCTPGTLYVRSNRGHQFAIRVSGVTGRARLYHFDPATARWGPD